MSEESRMKKTIIRIAVCVVVFLASALIIGSIMNQGHNNMTMEMAPATLPMITMESGGVACNELHGNTVEMDVAYQKDCITLLGEGRQANFTVDTFGREITGISTEVRSIDGSRLIENSEVTGWKANGKSFSVSLTLKDLIDTNTQYSLTLILELEGEQKVYYYTTIYGMMMCIFRKSWNLRQISTEIIRQGSGQGTDEISGTEFQADR